MELLTNPSLTFYFVNLSQIYQLFVLVCLTAVIYKFATYFVRGRNLRRDLKDFPRPPAHWFFGHALMVGYL